MERYNKEDEIEVVDLKQYICSGKPIPERTKYYLIDMDGEKMRVQSPISAREILIVFDLDPDDYCVEQVLRGGKTLPLDFDDVIDLRERGIERFVSKVKRFIKIFVNTREKEVKRGKLSYKDVIELAYDDPPTGEFICFTITYENGPRRKPEGSLVEGQSVKVKSGMRFNVSFTDKS